MKQSRYLTTIALFSFFVFISCTKKNETSSSPDSSAAQKVTNFKVGLVLDKGGRDDKSFNQAAFTGATLAAKDFGVEIKEVESPDDDSFEPAMRTFADRGYNLVIAIGFSQADAVKKVAPLFPNVHFAIVDAVVAGPNIASLIFSEHEGSYLVGYLAGLATQTNKIGFVGGMDTALIRRFQMGYEAGAKAAKPGIQLVTNYVGINGSAWNNPGRGKELALTQYGNNVDIIFTAAGATNMGVFDAAEEKKKFAIGVDSNQNYIKPGRIITSMLKRVDTAVYEVIRSSKDGKFKSGTEYFGFKNKGVDFAVDQHNLKFIQPYVQKLDDIKTKISQGTIKVPDYYELQKK